VGGDDERRAAGEGGDQARRDEEMGVDDVGLRRRARALEQVEVAALPAGTAVEHRELDLVAARAERELDLAHERAEIGRAGAGVHLRDEQDPHGRTLCAGG
jgi:hypothetical protein